jgi:hypothetical protein
VWASERVWVSERDVGERVRECERV